MRNGRAITKVLALRSKTGLRQIDVAARLEVSPGAVNRIEKTGIRTIRLARKYAAVLGCDALELLE